LAASQAGAGKRGEEMGRGREGVRGRHPRGDRRRNERGEQRWTARAVQHCPNKGALGASDAWALADSGRERERRATGRVGQPREKGNGPSSKE
jgi:hypothetical protein